MIPINHLIATGLTVSMSLAATALAVRMRRDHLDPATR